MSAICRSPLKPARILRTRVRFFNRSTRRIPFCIFLLRILTSSSAITPLARSFFLAWMCCCSSSAALAIAWPLSSSAALSFFSHWDSAAFKIASSRIFNLSTFPVSAQPVLGTAANASWTFVSEATLYSSLLRGFQPLPMHPRFCVCGRTFFFLGASSNSSLTAR